MKAYVEHVGVTVKDIEWDVKFFRDVLGMEITRTREDDEGNWQMVWMKGGLCSPGCKTAALPLPISCGRICSPRWQP